MTNGTTMRLAALAGAMLLAGCLHGGGGGGGGTLSTEDIDRVRSDPNVVRAIGIFERADTLLVPGAYIETSITAGGRTLRERGSARGTCQGTRCALDGESVSLEDFMAQDLVGPAATELNRAELGRREGFDTLVLEGGSRIPGKVRDSSSTTTTLAKSYGAWGEHGYAAVEIASGSYSEDISGFPFEGTIRGVVAYAFGDRNPTNPGGAGPATWQGPAEAASTRTFERREGLSTLTIPDLAQPRLSVGIDIEGFDISAPGWDDMPVTDGRFASDVGGVRMEGSFHGPNHEEAYGVFDTGAYVGAFGAKRR